MRIAVEELSGPSGRVGRHVVFVPLERITVHDQFIETHPHQVPKVFGRLVGRIGGDVHRKIDMLPDTAPPHAGRYLVRRTARAVPCHRRRQGRPGHIEQDTQIFEIGIDRMQDADRVAGGEDDFAPVVARITEFPALFISRVAPEYERRLVGQRGDPTQGVEPPTQFRFGVIDRRRLRKPVLQLVRFRTARRGQ